MSDTHVVIIGTGAEARLAADIIQARDGVVLGFLYTGEEPAQRDLNDISIFAKAGDEDSLMVLQDTKIQYIVTQGDIKDREKAYLSIADIVKRPAANAVHPGAWVSPYAKLGFGNLVNFGAAVNANAEIGDNNHLHTGASVEPDAKVGNYCTLSAGVRIGAHAQVEDNVFIGTGAVIYPGVKIGKGALIGAGAVVLREVKAKGRVHGNPAVEV